MLQRTKKISILAFVLSLSWVVCVCGIGVEERDLSQSAATRQRAFAGGRSNAGPEKRSAGRKNSSKDKNVGDEIAFVSSRKLQSKITSKHNIRLEFSGVTYASWSLDLVKQDLVGVVRDVLTNHLEDGIELIHVKRIDGARMLHPPSRKLSYISLAVRISLRHPSWISSERTLTATIEILSKYVDNGLQDYMRNLPGNGDYAGTVDVTDYYNDFTITVPTTTTTTEPNQLWQTARTGSFQFDLVFPEVRPNLSTSKALQNYIRYSVEAILNNNLDSDIQVVDVSLTPPLFAVPEVSLKYPMMVILRFPAARNDAFAHADGVLSRHIKGIELYVNEYFATSSLTNAENSELESALKEIFGQTVRIEIERDVPAPTQALEIKKGGPAPTQAPTKLGEPTNNEWWNFMSEGIHEMPWWGWVVAGVGLTLLTLCCCCCAIQTTRRLRAKEPATMTNIVYVREPDTNPTTDGQAIPRKGPTIGFGDEKEEPMNEIISGEEILPPPPQRPAGMFLYSANPIEDVHKPKQSTLDPVEQTIKVVQKPNQSTLDPVEQKQRKKKEKKKRDP